MSVIVRALATGDPAGPPSPFRSGFLINFVPAVARSDVADPASFPGSYSILVDPCLRRVTASEEPSSSSVSSPPTAPAPHSSSQSQPHPPSSSTNPQPQSVPAEDDPDAEPDNPCHPKNPHPTTATPSPTKNAAAASPPPASIADLPDPDLIIITSARPDRCDEETLCQLSPHIQFPILAARSAASRIRSWRHFDNSRVDTFIPYTPKNAAEGGSTSTATKPSTSSTPSPSSLPYDDREFDPEAEYSDGIYRITLPAFSRIAGKDGLVTLALLPGLRKPDPVAVAITYQAPTSVLSSMGPCPGTMRPQTAFSPGSHTVVVPAPRGGAYPSGRAASIRGGVTAPAQPHPHRPATSIGHGSVPVSPFPTDLSSPLLFPRPPTRHTPVLAERAVSVLYAPDGLAPSQYSSLGPDACRSDFAHFSSSTFLSSSSPLVHYIANHLVRNGTLPLTCLIHPFEMSPPSRPWSWWMRKVPRFAAVLTRWRRSNWARARTGNAVGVGSFSPALGLPHHTSRPGTAIEHTRPGQAVAASPRQEATSLSSQSFPYANHPPPHHHHHHQQQEQHNQLCQSRIPDPTLGGAPGGAFVVKALQARVWIAAPVPGLEDHPSRPNRVVGAPSVGMTTPRTRPFRFLARRKKGSLAAAEEIGAVDGGGVSPLGPDSAGDVAAEPAGSKPESQSPMQPTLSHTPIPSLTETKWTVERVQALLEPEPHPMDLHSVMTSQSTLKPRKMTDADADADAAVSNPVVNVNVQMPDADSLARTGLQSPIAGHFPTLPVRMQSLGESHSLGSALEAPLPPQQREHHQQQQQQHPHSHSHSHSPSSTSAGSSPSPASSGNHTARTSTGSAVSTAATSVTAPVHVPVERRKEKSGSQRGRETDDKKQMGGALASNLERPSPAAATKASVSTGGPATFKAIHPPSLPSSLSPSLAQSPSLTVPVLSKQQQTPPDAMLVPTPPRAPATKVVLLGAGERIRAEVSA